MKLRALKTFLAENRTKLVNDGFNYAKENCNDLGIVMERQRCLKKKKQTFGEGSRDAELPYDIEQRREMFSSLDRVIEGITLRFQQLHALAEKYAFLTPLNLLDDKYKCQLDHDHDDFDKEEFLIERKRLQNFIAVADIEGIKMRKEGPLELLQFIQKYNLGNSVPNIIIMLRIFLTIAVSVATCERSFSKLKLIKNYLRSSMRTLRLRNLAILSIEEQLTDEINFDIVIKEFANKKARKVTV